MKFCSYCGAGLDADMRFCPKCRKPFEESKDNPHISGKHLKPESPTYDSTPVGAPPKEKKRGGIIAIVIVAVLIAVGAGLYFSGVFAPKEEPKVSFSDDTAAIAEASNSVVMLSCYDKDGELFATGSGFAAFDEGVFVTNFHVIEGEVYSINAQTETGLEFKIDSVLAFDEDRDIAILSTEAKTGLDPLPVGNSSTLKRGEKVIAIGSPLGLINTLSIGLYSGTVKEEGQTYLQFSASISHGSSGGSLFNNNGQVVGITSASYEGGQNLNLAIPIENATALWETHIMSEKLSLPEFYDQWVHADFFDITYIRSHKTEFTGQTILTGGNVFYLDKNSDRFWIFDPSYDITSLNKESFMDLKNAAQFPMLGIFEKPSKVVFGEYITVQATAVLDHLTHVKIIKNNYILE